MIGKLIMCKGLPASGKSSWALAQVERNDRSPGMHAHTFVRVNKDDIRAELFMKDWNYDKEKEVLRIRDFKISQALSKGLTVISDDTNLAPKHEVRLRELALKYKAAFEVNDTFLTTPLKTCIERDRVRDAKVGEKVIVKMAEDYLAPSELISRTAAEGGPQLFLDLDGVLADFDGFIERELGIVNNRENEDPDFWDKARAYKGRLYYDMKPLPDAKALFDALRPFKPLILTGCPWSIESAADDKRQWVYEQIDPKVEVVCCKSRNKRLYARAGDLILDDWTKYKTDWEAKCGPDTFIHYTGDIKASLKTIKEKLHHA